MEIGKVAVFGATGSVGRALVRELVRRHVPTVVVARDEVRLGHDFSRHPVERRALDLTEPGNSTQVASGCSHIFLCAGVPLHRYDQHLALVHQTIRAMRDLGARGVLASSYWSYAPLADEPVTEDHPRPGANPKSRVRKEMEDLFAEAGGAVCHLPDFYGPECSSSMLNDALAALREGRTVHWPGSLKARRDFLFIEDAGGLLLRVAAADAAYGRRWNVPGSGALPPRELLRQAAALGKRKLRAGAIPGWMFVVGGLFSPRIRHFRQVRSLYCRPAEMSGERLRGLIGPLGVTPYERGLRQTLTWLGHGVSRGS